MSKPIEEQTLRELAESEDPRWVIDTGSDVPPTVIGDLMKLPKAVLLHLHGRLTPKHDLAASILEQIEFLREGH